MMDKTVYEEWMKDDQNVSRWTCDLLNRECAVLGTPETNTGFVAVRNINVSAKEHLIQNLYRFKLYQDRVNMYRSVALLQNMPVFSFNFETRKEESKRFDTFFNHFMIGYDLVFDLDAKSTNSKVALKEVRIVHDAFLDMKIPHEVLCSGSGFHITVQSKDVWTHRVPFHPERSIEMCKNIAVDMIERWELESMDLMIYDHRRILKLPFSMDVRTGRVCRPLSQYDIDHFSYHLCAPKYVRGNKRIYGLVGFGGTDKSLEKWMRTLL